MGGSAPYPGGVEDVELFAAWRAGDSDAGNALVERHFVGVFRFFSSKVPDAAEELTQKTFLACVESRDRLVPGSAFRAYLFGVARNQLMRHFERRGRSVQAEAMSRLSVADLAPSPSMAVAHGQRRAIVLDALRRLPVDHQIVIELVYWEQMPLRDVAGAIGVAAGTIKSRLHRARERLADEIAASLERGVSFDLEEVTRGLGLELAQAPGKPPP